MPPSKTWSDLVYQWKHKINKHFILSDTTPVARHLLWAYWNIVSLMSVSNEWQWTDHLKRGASSHDASTKCLWAFTCMKSAGWKQIIHNRARWYLEIITIEHEQAIRVRASNTAWHEKHTNNACLWMHYDHVLTCLQWTLQSFGGTKLLFSPVIPWYYRELEGMFGHLTKNRIISILSMHLTLKSADFSTRRVLRCWSWCRSSFIHFQKKLFFIVYCK